MLKTKINPYRHDYDHIVCVMKDMFFAENRACMGEIIKDDYVWIISANIGADQYKHMLYKLFGIEVEIAKYEKDTITLMMKNERRLKMERTCYSCKWYDESCLGIHCRACYGAVNWEPREVNTSKIHNYTERIKTKNDSVAAMVDGFVAYNNMNSYFLGTRPDYNRLPDIKNVIFNDPATIVFWSDGTKTVVKVQDGDEYDEEKGLAMAISKKALGNKGNYCNVFKKWLPEEDEMGSINIEYNGLNFLDLLSTSFGIKKEK